MEKYQSVEKVKSKQVIENIIKNLIVKFKNFNILDYLNE